MALHEWVLPLEAQKYTDPVEALFATEQVRRLERFREHNRYHGGPGEENMLVHTKRVYENVASYVYGLNKVFLNDYLLQQKFMRFMHAPIAGRWEYGQLAIAHAIVHDIGKPYVLQENAAHITSTPNHAVVGAGKMDWVYGDMEEYGCSIPPSVQIPLTQLVAEQDTYYPHIIDGKELEVDSRNAPVEALILLNMLGDLSAGRLEDPQDEFDGQYGFTPEHRAHTTELLASTLREMVV